MNYDKTLQVLKIYEDRLRPLVPVQKDGPALSHVLYMIVEMKTDRDKTFSKDTDKTQRWLGFIQGVLYTTGTFTIDSMRDHVTSAK